MAKKTDPSVFMTDSHIRSVIKGVTWRITGTVDTMMLAFIVTGTVVNAVKIGLTEVFTKIALYYLHERLWNIIPFGRIHGVGPTHVRSFIKGVSWRVVGTIDTIFVSYFITGHWVSAIKIGTFEVITKIFLFYLHERVWGNVKWGRIIRAEAQDSAVVDNKKEYVPELAEERVR
jgi:uncharacterized membrane protein